MSLSQFFKSKNIKITEGYTDQEIKQVNEITQILKNNQNLNMIMEIGFNAGHSSEIFLKNSNAYIYSFDLGDHFHEYLKYGKIFLNNKYPDRHTLVLGDSTKTIPNFIKNNNICFDLIFIDGGHEYDIAISDLLNCKQLANENTILIMDDINDKNNKNMAEYMKGPTKAWNECINNNIITETNSFVWNDNKGMSVGKYIFN